MISLRIVVSLMAYVLFGAEACRNGVRHRMRLKVMSSRIR